MKSLITDASLFLLPKSPWDAVVITTNGIVKSNGCAVMGKGIAKQADNIFHCSNRLGSMIKSSGNKPYNLGVYKYNGVLMHVLTFPTKEDWRNSSTIERIRKSAAGILEIVDRLGLHSVYLPPVGCGCGGLNWYANVEPVLSELLDDRFIVVLSRDKYCIDASI